MLLQISIFRSRLSYPSMKNWKKVRKCRIFDVLRSYIIHLLRCNSLNHYHGFFQWIRESLPWIPNYAHSVLVIPHFTVEVNVQTRVIPPTPTKPDCTIHIWSFEVFVSVVGCEPHTIVIPHWISWNTTEVKLKHRRLQKSYMSLYN